MINDIGRYAAGSRRGVFAKLVAERHVDIGASTHAVSYGSMTIAPASVSVQSPGKLVTVDADRSCSQIAGLAQPARSGTQSTVAKSNPKVVRPRQVLNVDSRSLTLSTSLLGTTYRADAHQDLSQKSVGR